MENTKAFPKPIASKVRVPAHKDGKGEPILANAKSFKDYILCGKIKRAMILLEDYDDIVGLKDENYRGRLNKLDTRYPSLLDLVFKFLLNMFYSSGEPF